MRIMLNWLRIVLLLMPMQGWALTLKSQVVPTGGSVSTGTFRLVTVGQSAIGAFPTATPATFIGFAYTIPRIVDISNPVIQNNMPANAVTTWFNTSPGPIIDVDFFDTGGSHLSRFETKITTDAGGVGVPLQDFVAVQSSADFGAFKDLYTANWALLPGTFDLMQQGANYVSVQVLDQAGNFSVALSTFMILKDTVPPNVPAGILFVGGGTGVAPTPVPAGGNRTITWCVDPVLQGCAATLVATDTVSGFSAFPVSLFYSTNSGVDFAMIASGVANSPAGYFWNPTPIVNSTQTVLRIIYTDLAGNVAAQNGSQFTIGQPDLVLNNLVRNEISLATRFGPAPPNPNAKLKLPARVFNDGLATAGGPIDVLFTSTDIPTVPQINLTDSFNGNLASGGNRLFSVTHSAFPQNSTFTVLYTVDPFNTVTESDETNNSFTAIIQTGLTDVVSIGACVINPLFSRILISFSSISALKNAQDYPLLTGANTIDLVQLHNAGATEIMATGLLPANGFSGVRLVINSVVGVRSDTGQQIVFNVPNPVMDVSLPFNVSTTTLTNETILFDPVRSIQQTGPDSFNFIPTLLSASVQRRSWEVSASTDFTRVGIGGSVDIPVTVSNTGTVDDVYQLSVFVASETVQAGLPELVSVPAGSSATIVLRLTAPSSIGAIAKLDIPFQVGAATNFLASTKGFISLPTVKAVDGILEIIGDLLPPQSILVAGQPSFGADPILISATTLLGIATSDDLLAVGDAAGLGVAEIRFAIDGGSFTVFNSSFSITEESTHTVSFFATDVAGNVEAVKTRSLAVDNTPPAAWFAVNGATVPSGAVTAAEGSLFGFAAQDPVSNGVASGASRTRFSVDSGTFTVFTSTFMLPLGTHTVVFEAFDNVENRSARETVVVTVIPPIVIALDLDPDTLNLKSQGQFVTAFVEVTGLKSAADIDAGSLKITNINGQPLAAAIPIVAEAAGKSGKLKFGTIGDHDLDGIPDLMVKFDRAALISVLSVNEQVRITVEGFFKDAQPLSADDFIRTIQPGTVKAFDSGTLAFPGGKALVSFPAGSLRQDTDVTILKLTAMPAADETRRSAAASVAKIRTAGRPFEFGPEGTQFLKPVTIVLPYDPASLPAGVKEDFVKIAYWNPTSQAWEILPSQVDKQAMVVTAQTTHFSQYQAMAPLAAEPEAAVPAADQSFRLGEVYAFPNPARRSQRPTLHIEAGLADSVDIHIYDVSGQLVHNVGVNSPPALIDDGQGPQYAYEYTWDTSGTGSGVYVYVVTAHKNGQGSLKRIGKCAVIK